jgi:DNA primase
LLDGELVTYRDEYWCRCPLPYGNHKHGDTNPSFSINLDESNSEKFGLYNCFVCGGGTFLHLASLLRDEDEDTVLAWLESLSMKEQSPDEFAEEIERILARNEKSSKVVMPSYHLEEYAPFKQIHPWVYEQGITREAVLHFQIGYDEENDAILFPHWWQGKLVGWQGRCLGYPDALDENGKKLPKWKNTVDFPKANTLFHYDECLDNYDEVNVVEAAKSTAVMWSRGMKNVVATFGAELNFDQIVPLWRFRRVNLWFDDDPAGVKATETATNWLRGLVDVYICPPVGIPKGDPADVDADTMFELHSQAVPSYLWGVT